MFSRHKVWFTRPPPEEKSHSLDGLLSRPLRPASINHSLIRGPWDWAQSTTVTPQLLPVRVCTPASFSFFYRLQFPPQARLVSVCIRKLRGMTSTLLNNLTPPLLGREWNRASPGSGSGHSDQQVCYSSQFIRWIFYFLFFFILINQILVKHPTGKNRPILAKEKIEQGNGLFLSKKCHFVCLFWISRFS